MCVPSEIVRDDNEATVTRVTQRCEFQWRQSLISCAGGSVSFSAAVQPIFTSHCANQGCHVGAGAKQGLNLASGKAYANLVGVAASECTNRKRVQPSDPSASYLIDKLLGTNLCSGSRMPKLAALPAADIGTIATWICSGAANN